VHPPTIVDLAGTGTCAMLSGLAEFLFQRATMATPPARGVRP
jgi:hypothetical protein